MKKHMNLILTGALCFYFGVSTNNAAMSDATANFKVAIVDVPKIVNNSKQATLLKEEQKKKISELSNYAKNAKTSIEKESDANKKKQLEEKYTKELTERKKLIEKEYTNKLIAIDKQISEAIKEKAVSNKYNIVLSKGVVLFGGEDITSSIIPSIK